jgi:hypothetical protein
MPIYTLKSSEIKYLLKMTVFWDVAQFTLVETDRRFRGDYCLYHQGDPDDADIKHL